MSSYGLNTWPLQPEFIAGANMPQQLPLPLPLGLPASAGSPRGVGFSVPTNNRPLPAAMQLPDPQYLSQMLGGQTLPQALQFPDYRKMMLPSLTGGYGFAITPERLNAIVGMTQQELQREQQFNQARFQNKAEGLRLGAALDTHQTNQAMAPLQARGMQMQNAQNELNYATGMTDAQKLDAQYRMQSALQAQQARDAYELALTKARQDKSLEIQKFGFQHAFNNAEATVKRWLSSMKPEDIAELQRNAVMGGDVGMLLANPNFQARTGATDAALLGALDLFKQAGVHPYYLIGANPVGGADSGLLPGPANNLPMPAPAAPPRTISTTTSGQESERFRLWREQSGGR